MQLAHATTNLYNDVVRLIPITFQKVPAEELAHLVNQRNLLREQRRQLASRLVIRAHLIAQVRSALGGNDDGLWLQILNHPAHGAQYSVDRIGRSSIRALQGWSRAKASVSHVKAIDDDGVDGGYFLGGSHIVIMCSAPFAASAL